MMTGYATRLLPSPICSCITRWIQTLSPSTQTPNKGVKRFSASYSSWSTNLVSKKHGDRPGQSECPVNGIQQGLFSAYGSKNPYSIPGYQNPKMAPPANSSAKSISRRVYRGKDKKSRSEL